MPTQKKRIPDIAELIHPQFVYRMSSPTARGVIGLGPTQTQEAIKRGELPPPIALTDSGIAKGWTGAQLLEVQQQRVAKAEAEAAARPTQTIEQQRRRHKAVSWSA
jgi:hypothetical protein